MTQKLIYAGLVIALILGVYYGQTTPQSEPPAVLESSQIDQAKPPETRSSKSASNDKVNTYSDTLSIAEIPVVSDTSDLRSLYLGDQFRLAGVTDNESLDIDVTVTQLDKNDLFTLMHGSIANGGTAIITLGGQSVNIFLKTDAGIFEFGGDNFDGNVVQLGDIEWGDDIYKQPLPKALPPNEPSLGVRLVEP
ncbi:hypothetical protein N9R09_03155 [Porticoccaceae bacterium]|nr:hypothetical protein [Porticoccaceae bacterium]